MMKYRKRSVDSPYHRAKSSIDNKWTTKDKDRFNSGKVRSSMDFKHDDPNKDIKIGSRKISSRDHVSANSKFYKVMSAKNKDSS